MTPIPLDFEACERGETWLHTEDYNGHMLVVRLADHEGVPTWLMTELIPENYPGFHHWVKRCTEVEMREFLTKEFGGWNIRRSNVEGLESRTTIAETD